MTYLNKNCLLLISVVMFSSYGCVSPLGADQREYCATQGGAWSEAERRCRALSSSGSAGESVSSYRPNINKPVTPIKIRLLVDSEALGFDPRRHAIDRAECHAQIAEKEHPRRVHSENEVLWGVLEGAISAAAAGTDIAAGVYRGADSASGRSMTTNYSRHKAARLCMKRRGYTLLD